MVKINPLGLVAIIAGAALGYVIASAFITAANVSGTDSTLLSVSLTVVAGAGAFAGIKQMSKGTK